MEGQNFFIEDIGESRYLVYRFSKADKMDMAQYNRLKNNSVDGILDVSMTSMGDDVCCKYDITSLISLRDYFGFKITQKKMINVFIKIAQLLVALESVLMDKNHLVLDKEYIFLDTHRSKVYLVCLPIMQPKQINVKEFFKEIFMHISFVQTENTDYIVKFMNYFNNNPYFDLKDFILFMTNLRDGISTYMQEIGQTLVMNAKTSETKNEEKNTENLGSTEKDLTQGQSIKESEEQSTATEETLGYRKNRRKELVKEEKEKKKRLKQDIKMAKKNRSKRSSPLGLIFLLLFIVGGAFLVKLFLDKQNVPIEVENDLLYIGESYMQEQDYENAVLTFEELRKTEKQNKKAYINLIDIYGKQGNTENIESIIYSAMDNVSQNQELYLTLYNQALGYELYDLSIEILRKGIEKTDGEVLKSLMDKMFPPVSFSLEDGTYEEGAEIELISDGSKIYYTLDGTMPDNNSTLYEGPIRLPIGKTNVMAVALSQYNSSGNINEGVFTIKKSEIIASTEPTQVTQSTQASDYVYILGINIEKADENKSFVVGTDVNKEDLKVVVKYSNGITETVDNFTYEPKTVLGVGDNKINVTYMDRVVEYILVGEQKKVSQLKAEYTGDVLTVGSTINKANIKVTKIYNTGETESATNFSYVPLTINNYGNNTLVVTCEDVRTTLKVTAEERNVKENPISDFNYNQEAYGMVITKYIGEATEVVIPSKIDGIDVISIGSFAFHNCTKVTSIIMPDTIRSVRGYGFYGCVNIKNIVISSSLSSIGEFAFWGCSSLTSISLPEIMENIEYNAFENCTSLKTINIPKKVTTIQINAFNKCPNLTIYTPKNSTGATFAVNYGIKVVYQ